MEVEYSKTGSMKSRKALRLERTEGEYESYERSAMTFASDRFRRTALQLDAVSKQKNRRLNHSLFRINVLMSDVISWYFTELAVGMFKERIQSSMHCSSLPMKRVWQLLCDIRNKTPELVPLTTVVYAPETGKKIKCAQNSVCTQKAQLEQNFCS
jgi:hypothetical protein